MKQVLVVIGCLAIVGCGGDAPPSDPDAMAAMPDAETGPTWTSFAADYFETYCFACHGPGDALRDYSDIAMVRAEAARIRSGTASGQFPIGSGPFPTDGERDLLVGWIDAGSPD